MIEVCKTPMFSIMVHRVDIIRLRKGPDHLYLHTNLPNPVWPFTGTLSIRLATTRGDGRKWVRENLNQNIEVTEADLETLPTSGGETPPASAPQALLANGETVASVERRATPYRPVLTLRRHR